jgi:hypothetical protein
MKGLFFSLVRCPLDSQRNPDKDRPDVFNLHAPRDKEDPFGINDGPRHDLIEKGRDDAAVSHVLPSFVILAQGDVSAYAFIGAIELKIQTDRICGSACKTEMPLELRYRNSCFNHQNYPHIKSIRKKKRIIGILTWFFDILLSGRVVRRRGGNCQDPRAGTEIKGRIKSRLFVKVGHCSQAIPGCGMDAGSKDDTRIKDNAQVGLQNNAFCLQVDFTAYLGHDLPGKLAGEIDLVKW